MQKRCRPFTAAFPSPAISAQHPAICSATLRIPCRNRPLAPRSSRHAPRSYFTILQMRFRNKLASILHVSMPAEACGAQQLVSTTESLEF